MSHPLNKAINPVSSHHLSYGFISREKSSQADRSRDQTSPGTVPALLVTTDPWIPAGHLPRVDARVYVARPPALTYSTRWGWMQPAGRRCAHWAPGRARGTPGVHACSSCRCLSRPSSARCQHFGASGCLRSRCCAEESQGHENHLT